MIDEVDHDAQLKDILAAERIYKAEITRLKAELAEADKLIRLLDPEQGHIVMAVVEAQRMKAEIERLKTELAEIRALFDALTLAEPIPEPPREET